MRETLVVGSQGLTQLQQSADALQDITRPRQQRLGFDEHDTTVDGTPAQRIVLGAWYEQGSYLVYENGRYELRELARTPSSGGESLATTVS